MERVELGVPVARHGLLVGVLRVEDLLELDVEVDKVLLDALKGWQVLVHCEQLLVSLYPLEVIQPLCRVGLLVDLTRWSSEEESPLGHVDLVVSEQNLGTEKEGEEELVDFEERSAHVLVECVCEVVVEDLDSADDVISLLRLLDGILEEVLEPLKGVLVHTVDVVEVNDAEE